MATATLTHQIVNTGEAAKYSCTLTNADTDCAPLTAHEYGDRHVQIGTSGTTGFGTGTVVVQGSNDGTNWFSLTDPQGNAISKTTASLETIMETPLYTRAAITGATGGESVPVIFFCRRTRK